MDTNALKKTSPAKEIKMVATEKKEKVKSPSEQASGLLNMYQAQIIEALGDPKIAKRFARCVINAIGRDPKLITAMHECPKSLVGSILMAAQLGLEPNTPLQQCFLIPYFEKNKATEKYEMRVNLQLGYQGVLALSYRSGDVLAVYSEEVYQKDEWSQQKGTDPFIHHVPYEGAGDAGPVVRYYAVVKLKNGGTLFKVWRADKVMDHAKKFSKSFNLKTGQFYGPWADNFDSMAKKTVLLDALKLCPKSAEFAERLAADSSTKSVPFSATNVNMLLERNEAFDNEVVFEAQDEAPVSSEEVAEEEPPKSLENLTQELGLVAASTIKQPKRKPEMVPGRMVVLDEGQEEELPYTADPIV